MNVMLAVRLPWRSPLSDADVRVEIAAGAFYRETGGA
jgi:hypothetical protein